MKVTQYKAAENGYLIPHLEPVPRAHVAVAHHPDISRVLSVNCGQVLELTTGQPDYCRGYAAGYNRMFTMNTMAVQEVDLPEAETIDEATLMYAHWFATHLRDEGGEGT